MFTIDAKRKKKKTNQKESGKEDSPILLLDRLGSPGEPELTPTQAHAGKELGGFLICTENKISHLELGYEI